MTDIKSQFAGKKVTVMGLGLLGRGVGDVAFFAECGAQIVVTDRKSEAELAGSIVRLSHYPNISFHLGGHQEEDFTQCDMVLKAAGVPLDSPYIAAARAAGVEVVMSTALFAQYAREAGATIVGVTGTRGKSTVTQMIFETLKQVGKDVLLGGNVRGVSTLALLPQVTQGTIAVLELDSWQLQGFGDLHISPQVSVFTNLMPDHQNYYSSMDQYFADKAYIYRNQHVGDTLVCGTGVRDRILADNPPVAPVTPETIPADWELQIIGEHNHDNASLAAQALRALGLSEEQIKTGLETFVGVEGRLQLVSDKNGIKIYNDNNATTPEATIVALKALSADRQDLMPKKNIILIMGGADKGLDASALLYQIAQSCKRVICLAGTGTTRVAPFMTDYSIFDSLATAVHEATTSAVSGDIILFSPAFASFGMFANEYDRNDQFMSLISNKV